VERRIARLVTVLEDEGAGLASVGDRLAELEARKRALAVDSAPARKASEALLAKARARLGKTREVFKGVRERTLPASEEFRVLLGKIIKKAVLTMEDSGPKLVLHVGNELEELPTASLPDHGIPTGRQRAGAHASD